METMIAVLGVLVCLISDHDLVIVGSRIGPNNRRIFPEEKQVLYLQKEEQPKAEPVIDVKNFFQNSASEMKKHRKIRKRKEKGGKISRQKEKSQKPADYLDKQILRNREKVNLVRNRTIEILKTGMRILSAGESFPEIGSKSVLRVNETLLEKILSSAVSKHRVSEGGNYQVTITGGVAYETRKENLGTGSSTERTTFGVPKRLDKKPKTSRDTYDYDIDFKPNLTNDSLTEPISLERDFGTILKQIVTVLKNLTDCPDGRCSGVVGSGEVDPCLKWLNCKESLDAAFSGENNHLPSCPCTYPSTIFYDDRVWDEKQKKYFRWKDASGDSERLDIYKPGAANCIRSLVTQGASTVSSQQCCYDRRLQLLTRGSGVGTVNFISPDVSKRLHYTVDILPWRLCKGDFTRYNTARNPNNGNDCPENPDDQQYQLQIKHSKIF